MPPMKGPNRMPTKTGKQILAEFLDCFEVDHVFGNPGTTETTFLDVVAGHPRCRYVLGLHESTATGIAAGYAIKSGKPAVLNIHTYPGLANAMSSMFNAYAAGIPLLVIAGQQNRAHLIHEPILSGDLTLLAHTATHSRYQVDRISDMSVLLQRAYLDASESKSPCFVALPMEIYQDETADAYFKPTKILGASASDGLDQIAEVISGRAGKTVFVADAEAAWSPGIGAALRDLSLALDADVFLAPFSLVSMADVDAANYRGVLPAVSSEANEVLSGYDIVILLGEKIQSFLHHEKPTLPAAPTIVQFSDGRTRIRYDCPFDFVVRGDIAGNLSALRRMLNVEPPLERPRPSSAPDNATLLWRILNRLDRGTPIVIEGSSHQSQEEQIVAELRFREVYFEPRGGALGMAMPMTVGMSLHSGTHSVCLLGDGGSMYSIHSIWTAAHYRIPVVFICVVNHEYKILKQLWKLQVPDSDPESYRASMDLTDPEVDLHAIVRGFGGRVDHATPENFEHVLAEAFGHRGPTFITVDDTDLGSDAGGGPA